jgi:glycosyltransferase involved in cell wall biosynthesis
VAAVKRAAREIQQREPTDLVVADYLFAADNVWDTGPAPVVLFEHNVEYLIWQRLATLERAPWRRALFELEWRKLRRQEAAACRRAALTLAVSDADRVRLAAMAPAASFDVIPTGVDTDYFAPSGAAERPGALVFTGSMDWHPNEDAVCHFCDDILPRIRERLPHATFTIAGRNPGPRVRSLASRAGIVVTGTVDDVRPHIAAAAVYVVPLRAGSGTRLKIFEALAMAKAIVSTTVGAEGLALTPDREIVMADDPTSFAARVIDLFDDPARRRRLGEAGRTLVETHYSWPQIARAFEASCLAALPGAHATVAADRRPHLSRA